jgi:hypothetical protein
MMSVSENGAASLPSAYQLDPAGYPAFRKSLSILIPLLLIGFTCLLWFFDTPRSMVRLVFIPVLICWIAYRQAKEEQRNWESLEFDFRDGKLVRSLDKYPPLEFMPSEVTAIVEYPKGIAVKTNDRRRTVFVSNRLSNFDPFRRQLESWAPAAPVTKWAPSPRYYAGAVCELLACAWVFGGPLYRMYTERRALILPLGIALALSMLGIIPHVRNSPHMPVRAQRGTWMLKLLPILMMCPPCLGPIAQILV